MLDMDNVFGMNVRPAFLPGFPGVEQFALFPSNIAPNYIDLQTVLDLARANPVYLNCRVATAFNNQADILMRFIIVTSSDPTFADVLTNPQLIVAKSHDLTPTGLAAVGAMVQVAMPPASTFVRLGGEGRRFVAAGMQGIVPTLDFVAGGIDAFLTRHALPTVPLATPSGY